MLVASAFLLSFLAVPALAADIPVEVGAGGLVFAPSSVTAAVGDRVVFTFTGTHSATLSSFDAPCEAATTNAFSIFSNGAYDVVDTDPKWFFCAVGQHCAAGMVFAINPTESQSFAAFQAAAVGNPAPAASSGMSSVTSSAAVTVSSSGSLMSSMSAAGSSSASRAASSVAAAASSVASSARSAASAAASSARPNSAGFISAGMPSTELAVVGLVGAAAMLLL